MQRRHLVRSYYKPTRQTMGHREWAVGACCGRRRQDNGLTLDGYSMHQWVARRLNKCLDSVLHLQYILFDLCAEISFVVLYGNNQRILLY